MKSCETLWDNVGVYPIFEENTSVQKIADLGKERNTKMGTKNESEDKPR